jgi:pyruvate/2-oxoacid:ferredoxin oxidoreductase beta subunit
MATSSTTSSIAMPAMAAGLRRNMRIASTPGCSTRTAGFAWALEDAAAAAVGIVITLLMRP